MPSLPGLSGLQRQLLQEVLAWHLRRRLLLNFPLALWRSTQISLEYGTVTGSRALAAAAGTRTAYT